MKDLSGLKFGRLTVLSFAGVILESKKYTWLCMCDCGKTKIIRAQPLVSGRTTSCGCFHREMVSKRETKHGLTKRGCKKHPLYNIWIAMKSRCYNNNQPHYFNYGGRGVSVCDRWINDFTAFVEDMGVRPSLTHSIDRIDNNGNYEPSNCKWSTDGEQSRNKRTNIWIEYAGEKRILADWASVIGISQQNLRSMLRYNTLGEIMTNIHKPKK